MHTPQQTILEKIAECERKIQEEWQTTWEELLESVEKEMDTILTNPTE